MSRHDILTGVNLQLIKDNKNHCNYLHFHNENGESLEDELGDIDSKDIMLYMSNECGLIDCHGEICKITKKGFDIINNGGWIKYLERENKQVEIESDKETERQELKDEIDRLTKVNLELQNKQMKRYIIYSIIAFILGGILTNLKDIFQLLNLQ
ncbi:MAG TPA: hypothetical protein VKN14_02410 [Flavobacteriaceae bacterium]|nr:hypothetical protein [Flavobacteriaceae bacterium]